MEFSSYCYHSNFRQCVITFINRDNKWFKVIVEDMVEEDHMREYKETTFVMTREELEDIYELYALSIYMTKYPKNLVFYKEMWCIETLINWRNSYITNEYTKTYGFASVPTEMNIPKNNNETKKFYVPVLNAIVSNMKINHNLYNVIHESVINMIERDLVKEETLVYTQKRNYIFAMKALSDKLPDDLIKTVVMLTTK